MPLLKELSERGLTAVLVNIPFNLAVLDQDAANEVFPLLPDIDEWYISGNSLGGAMASSFIDSSNEPIKSLILLSSYSTEKVKLPSQEINNKKKQLMQ